MGLLQLTRSWAVSVKWLTPTHTIHGTKSSWLKECFGYTVMYLYLGLLESSICPPWCLCCFCKTQTCGCALQIELSAMALPLVAKWLTHMYMYTIHGLVRVCIIGASLSEPHTSESALKCLSVCTSAAIYRKCFLPILHVLEFRISNLR